MSQTQQIDRKKILDIAAEESELSDLKQHADKMIRGFENFNDFSSARAIWELVQNACDLTNEGEVTVDYRNKGFSFTHNGEPFTTKALISLVKQVSGKYGEETELPEVGKYGTGFLTTHAFGRRFFINSVLKAEDTYFEIKNFEIDRRPREWKPLSNNIRTQKENVFKLIKEGAVLSNPTVKTTFTYLPETPQEFKYIAESAKDLDDYVMIVLTINDRLRKVCIIDANGKETTFLRKSKKNVSNTTGINLYRTEITKDGINKVFYSIIEEEDEVEIILPINENLEVFQYPDSVARLFLFYPLVGSHHFGINFIINSNKFLPTEPRDGIHLKSSKDQVKDQETENRRILEKAFSLIFDFLKSEALSVTNPLFYAQINFKRNSDNNLLNEYFKELQNLWGSQFQKLPIIETGSGFKSAEEVLFFSQELLNSEDAFRSCLNFKKRQKKSEPVRKLKVTKRLILWNLNIKD